MDASSFTIEELSRRTNLSKSEIELFLKGEIPSYSNLVLLASALSVNTRDLLPSDAVEKKVIVQKYQDAKKWHFPANTKSYLLTELTNTIGLPNSKALELTILKTDTEILEAGLHQYVYNLGDKTIDLEWMNNRTKYSKKINPGDSFYMKPFVPHSFKGEGGKLLILRIGGRVVGEPQIELSNLGPEGALRALGEAEMWFNPEGKN
jgi:methylphosphonate synthase